MSAFTSNPGVDNLTVSELRAYLDKVESEWTALDARYFGPFADTKIHAIVVYECKFAGVGNASISLGSPCAGPLFIVGKP